MKRNLLVFSFVVILGLTMILCGNTTHAAIETTIEEIMADKGSYEGKEVSVSGTVSSPKFKASRTGKAYMTFPILGDSGGRINILFWGTMKIKPGKKVKVTGIYRMVMKMGKYTFRDMIEASNVNPSPLVPARRTSSMAYGGEGRGEGENLSSTPTSILPHQVVATRNRGGGYYWLIFHRSIFHTLYDPLIPQYHL
jgi:hypothetical protein